MGIKLFSTSSYDEPRKKIIIEQPSPNPNPLRYKIIRSKKIGRYLIVKINYPDCKNYEGNKILVYKDCTLKRLLLQKSIDPHFSRNKKFKSPFARFEPTIEGWVTAIKLIKLLTNENKR